MVYSYGYDQLNRLVNMYAYYAQNNVYDDMTATHDYAEAVSYDPNGNIRTYFRDGVGNNMDNLMYQYPKESGTGTPLNNRLRGIFDAAPSDQYKTDIDNQTRFTTREEAEAEQSPENGDDNYYYDETGNLITDKAGKIEHIDWTVYGKIQTLFNRNPETDRAQRIYYTYDASGNRISKQVVPDGGMDETETTTFYVRDAQGNVMAVYAGNDERMVQNEIDLYGSSRLGLVSGHAAAENLPETDEQGYGPAQVSTFIRGEKQYELSNHLGNVLTTISDRRQQQTADNISVRSYTAEVVSATDYYPFGMQMPGRIYNASSSYRYGFNGKENDNDVKGEGNQLDFGERIYDPRVGSWLSVDPLLSKYPGWSPYNYALRNPVWINDPDGEDVHITISNTPSGHYTELRVIGSENVSGAPQSLRVHLYKMTVTDDVTKTISTYYVTRDSYVLNGTTVIKGSDGKNEVLYNIENVPFEPKVSVGKYTAVEFNYPSQAVDGVPTNFTAYAFRENGQGNLDAVPMPYSVEIGQRKKADQAGGVMIHVGGEYTDQNGQGHVTGSFGCFGVCDETGTGGNENINVLNKDINDRQAKQVVYKKDNKGNVIKKNGKPVVDKDYGRDINVNVQKRSAYRNNFKVNKDGRIK